MFGIPFWRFGLSDFGSGYGGFGMWGRSPYTEGTVQNTGEAESDSTGKQHRDQYRDQWR
ncbi:hypothetical protein HNI00_10015 [Thermoleptolyngbya oregonensis NK1-22]|uniref:Uncharacterized protein n=1 Tax=Thermoleptolyngbya oregonensis NK1-22 TaxID=2547457 RepID=A0AA96Y421_9CYAN|nr:hypothetical protein [Thermoleptolyngbya oregonensis]WOB43455.1 hypothetical protein HNI00_10015 [Thermoleptolyngbya oregonensis NK1-22]